MYHWNEWQSGAEECFWPHDPTSKTSTTIESLKGLYPADLPPRFRSRGAATIYRAFREYAGWLESHQLAAHPALLNRLEACVSIGGHCK